MPNNITLMRLERNNFRNHYDDVNRLLKELSSSVRKADTPMSMIDRRMRGALKNPYTYIWLALRGGKVVGMGTFYGMPHPSKCEAYIHDIVRDKDYRGHGIGAVIMGQLLRDAHELANEFDEDVMVHLTSNPNRKEANELYIELGFFLASQAVHERGTNLYKKLVAPF